MSYQRNPGFCDKVGSSLVGILVGLVLLVVGSGLLFWNEVKFYVDVLVKKQDNRCGSHLIGHRHLTEIQYMLL